MRALCPSFSLVRVASLGAATAIALTLAGCSPSFSLQCRSSADCPRQETCVQGRCGSVDFLSDNRSSTEDGGISAPDPNPLDAGATSVDAGGHQEGNHDAGNADAGDADAGDTDAGDTDAGDTDAGDTDAGDTDAGDTDAGDTDAGGADAGGADAGQADAGPADGGVVPAD